MELAMIGLGRMGANMAERLVRGGHTVRGYDPGEAARQQAEARGIVPDDADRLARRAWHEHDQVSLDWMWYLWCGRFSPLSGRVVKTFERTYFADRSTWEEPRDPYFSHTEDPAMCARVLEEFARFREVNLFLRGMVPLVGFKSTCVTYERHERIAGESHYPLSKMLALAFDGITSLSIKPIRFITGFGVFVALVSFIGVLWAVIEAALGLTVSGWASMTSIICFVSGVQLICLGVIGEYIGKIYLESKHRPRYIISDATPSFGEIKEDAQ